MKKLLYNKDRTKIFNLDHLVSVERIDEEDYGKGIVLKFSSEDYFLVVPGKSSGMIQYFKDKSGCFFPDYCSRIYSSVRSGNYEENKKLFEYFENKFTKSSLCQKVC